MVYQHWGIFLPVALPDVNICREMRCPYCQADKDNLKVIDSRSCDGDRAIRRRRECENCAKRFTTYERLEESAKLMVIKRDGRRMPWDRLKVISGLERACYKRPVPETELLRIADEVEEETFAKHDREVQTEFVGSLLSEKLRGLDEVAYVRFASVYKKFKTLDELVNEAQAVIDAKRFSDDPTQGKLFLDAPLPKGGKGGLNGRGERVSAERVGGRAETGRESGRKATKDSAIKDLAAKDTAAKDSRA
jgi:transcriptional repressor NrdR